MSGSGWRAAAAARLNSFEAANSENKMPSESLIFSNSASAGRRAEDIESALEDAAGTLSMADLEAEILKIKQKLVDEQKAIDEVKSLRFRRKSIDSAVAHASRKVATKEGEAEQSFFLTSVLEKVEDRDAEPTKSQQSRELYPNFRHELKLAKDSSAYEKQISRLREDTGLPKLLSKPGKPARTRHVSGT